MKSLKDARGAGDLKMSVPQYEFENEYEFEGEYEGEQIIGRVLAAGRRLLGRGGGSAGQQQGAAAPRRPSQGIVQRVGRRLIPTLVRVLATGTPDMPVTPTEQPAVVARDERQRGAAGGPPPDREYEFEGEYEGEFEDEYEFEGELEGEYESARQNLRPPALMRYLGHAAERADSEDEAEAMVGALVPLAAQAVPRAASSIMRVAPQLITGLSDAARTLRRTPQTRPLVSTLPGIMQRTAASLAHNVARGRAVTPQTAARTLARQTAYVLGTPRVREQMMSEGSQPRGGRGTGPFNITPPPEDPSVQGQARRATTSARRSRPRFRRATEILRDAQAQSNATPQQEF